MNKYSGKIHMLFEMGCGQWPQFHDNRGLHGDKNQFFNWDYTINFGKQTKIPRLLTWDDQGEVLYDGPWTYSKENTIFAPNYIPTPEELDTESGLNLYRRGHLNC